MKTIEFKLKSKLTYVRITCCLWLVSAIVIYLIFTISNEVSVEEILMPLIPFSLSGVIITWHHSRTFYRICNGYLHIRTPHTAFYTLPIEQTVSVQTFSKAKFNFWHGVYTLKITLKNKKNYYLFPESEEKLIAIMKEENPEIKVSKD